RSEHDIVEMWVTAERVLDSGDLIRAQGLFSPACDAVVALAMPRRRKPMPYREAADVAATFGLLVSPAPPVTAVAARDAAVAAKTVMPQVAAAGLRLAL